MNVFSFDSHFGTIWFTITNHDNARGIEKN